MRLAWFRAESPHVASPTDDSATLIGALRAGHDIALFTPATVGRFTEAHARLAFDLPVYELDQAPDRAWMDPHLLRHAGVLMLRTLAVPSLGTALAASRLTVVPYAVVAEELRHLFPGGQVRVAATCVPASTEPTAPAEPRAPVVFGALSAGRTELLHRVMAGAGLAPGVATVTVGASAEEVLRDADVILAVEWPWAGQPASVALAGMAAGKPVVVLETVGTADWPALDPQSWQPRGPTADTPVVISIDPLDEEHSLVLAVRRLAAEPALRQRLGAAGRRWWETHATPAHAAADWEGLLREAATTRPLAAE